MLLGVFTVQRNILKQKYEAKAYEQDSAARSLEAVTEQIEEITNAAGSTTNYKNSDVYKSLVAYQSVYDTKKDQLKLEMDVLKAQIDNCEKAIDDGIKENTSWSIFG